MVAKVKKIAIIDPSFMPPQAAAAQLPNPAEELQSTPEAAVETQKGPENAIDQAMETANVEKVVSIFRGRANQEKQALARLGQMDAEELEASPDASAQVEAANDASYKEIDQAEEQAIQEVVSVMEPGIVAAETEVAKEAVTEAAPAPVVEAVKAAPVVVVEDAPPVLEVKAERNEMAEQQKIEAEEVMKADLDALKAYAQEHHLTLDAATNSIPEGQLSGLMPVERTYVAVLQAKYRAGEASKAHAETLMAVAAETDPTKKKELSQQALALSEDAALKEKAATMMNAQYMSLPEISALFGGGNPTGGSYGGNAFEKPASPIGGKPKEPPPEAPIYAGQPLYTGGGTPGDGIAKIEAYKTPDSKVAPRKPRKPNFIERWVNRNVKDLTYDQIDPDKKGRE